MTDDVTLTTTRTVLELASAVSQREPAGHEDPISAGFDSIAIIELAMRLEERLGVVCSIEDVFDATSFDALGEELAGRLDAAHAG
ncbi:acyl carrier protein [Amycolatopsis sp. NPDC005003]